MCQHWIHVVHVLDIAMSKSTFLTEYFMILLYFMWYCILLCCVVLYFSVFYTLFTSASHRYAHVYIHLAKHNQNILTQQFCWLYLSIHVHKYSLLIQQACKQVNKSNSNSFISLVSFSFTPSLPSLYYLQFCHWNDSQFIGLD